MEDQRLPLRPGERVPEFSLPAANRDGMVSLAELRGRPFLIGFYRGLHCPFCRRQLVQLGAVATMVVLGSTISDPSAREMGMMVPALGAQLLTQKYGRDAERESDEYGMLYMSEAGYDPQGAVQLQQTFLELSEGRDSDPGRSRPGADRSRSNSRAVRTLGETR